MKRPRTPPRRKPTRARLRLFKTPRSDLRRLTDAEKRTIGKKVGGAYFVSKNTTKVTRRTAAVTVSSWQDFQLGISHGKAASMRKAGRLGYGPHGEIPVVPQAVKTRDRLSKSQYKRPWERPYMDRKNNDEITYDYFWKQGLRRLQDYEDAFDVALATNDGTILLPFKHVEFRTYDGPELT